MSEDEATQELKLPITFYRCPNCGSERRFSREAVRGRELPAELKGKTPILMFAQMPVPSPSKLYMTIYQAILDICVDCGTVYAVALVKTQATPTVQKGGGPPPQPPFKPFAA